jgi:hypothetical protein
VKVLAPLAISLLLVSGCSSTPESKPEYDEVELVEYETCLNTYMGNPFTAGLTTRQLMTYAMSACEDLRPIKRI